MSGPHLRATNSDEPSVTSGRAVKEASKLFKLLLPTDDLRSHRLPFCIAWHEVPEAERPRAPSPAVLTGQARRARAPIGDVTTPRRVPLVQSARIAEAVRCPK
jgi:hypothetical protein